ncbi:hypothetical protein GCM10010272_22320 [Streptomyces lateritius]|nr:hypothetical protein GCM10010272_22320 [Streptomyces lateritius]
MRIRPTGRGRSDREWAGPRKARGGALDRDPEATVAPDTTRVDGDQRIPLITGDRMVVDAEGRVGGFASAEGREHIPVQVQRTEDHTLVVPSDAQRLIATGGLDQRLRSRRAHRPATA